MEPPVSDAVTPSAESRSVSATFADRHIGPTADEIERMVRAVGYDTVDALVDAAVPDSIRSTETLRLPEPASEVDALGELRVLAGKNSVATSMIGQGYYGTFTPSVIVRRLVENPAWYTAYTPYQPEISQGRLEALLNFQTTVADLTGLPTANASLLDEGTAAAEAMTLARWFRHVHRRSVSRSWSRTPRTVYPRATSSACCCSTRAPAAWSAI